MVPSGTASLLASSSGSQSLQPSWPCTAAARKDLRSRAIHMRMKLATTPWPDPPRNSNNSVEQSSFSGYPCLYIIKNYYLITDDGVLGFWG